jgi:hypothetical protein
MARPAGAGNDETTGDDKRNQKEKARGAIQELRRGLPVAGLCLRGRTHGNVGGW